jgi:hypothetical protein
MGVIGRMYEADVRGLLAAVREVLTGMRVKLPVTQIKAD